MKKFLMLSIPAAVATLSLGSMSFAAIGVVDTFDTPANALTYVRTTVLDSDAVSDTTLSSPSGSLQVSRAGLGTAPTGPEQTLFLRPLNLAVGEQLRVDFAAPGTNPTVYGDFGIAVAATPTPVVYNPVAGGNQQTRADYTAIYYNPNQGLLKSIGINGTTILANANANRTVTGSTISELFITRNSETGYTVGYRVAGVDTNYNSYTIANTATANNIGFYSDLRGITTVGSLDNLRIVAVPEPTTLAVAGLAGVVMGRRRRA